VSATAAETVLSLLERAVAEAGDSLAVITPGASLTYAELDRASRRLAGSLAAAGICPGERVALWLPNGIDWLVAHWAAARNGNSLVPISTRLPASLVRRRLEHAEAVALFACTGFESIDQTAALQQVLAEAPSSLRLVVVRGSVATLGAPAMDWEQFVDAGKGVEATEVGGGPDDIHLIQYTSGTTGEPKGAMLAQRGLVHAARAHAAAWSLAPGDAVFVPNPFSHILGFVYGCLVPAAAGAPSATLAVFAVDPALELLASSRAAAMTGAPTHLQMLVESPDLERFDLGCLRLAMTGGAAIAPDWVRKVTRGLGLEAVLNGYGMSEAGSVAQTRVSDPPEVLAASIGYLMEDLEGRVVDPESGLDVSVGQPGELWIRGTPVMRGYLEDAELTARVLTPQGWLRTGDLVRRDEEERMFFAGRLEDMFTVGGFNVYPLAVERALEQHPAVAEVAVVGVEDRRLGAVPVALLRLSGAMPGQEELDAFCKERLASYEVPRRFEAVESLPRNPAGKIDRKQLASLAVQEPLAEPDEPRFGNYFVAAYPPFSQWSEAAVTDFERVLEAPPTEQVPLGLYCHIPFCVERCSYCYYLSHSGRELQRFDEYMTALVAELREYAARPVFAGRPLDFVYFGGGTPSILSTSRLQRLLGGLAEVLPWSAVREVTFECAPRSVTVDKLKVLRDAGVTRLSLGVQQLDDEVLERNGRVHLVADVEAAYAAVRQVGFDVVNLDLMVGLVGETEASVGRSLDRVLQLAPDSVTVYQLEIPFNTPLCRELRHGEVDPPPASWAEKHVRLQDVFARLAAAGYHRISAYTAVRDPERHGFVYQDALYHGADLLGLGVSAFAYVQRVHHQNAVALDDYLAALAGSRLPYGRAYALSEEECAIREMVLQLKLGRVECGWFRAKYGMDVLERFAEPLRRFTELGWLCKDATAIELTPEGIPRADRMLPAFYQQRHRTARYS